MNELTALIIIIILIMVISLNYQTHNSDVTYVKSNVDNKYYLVRNRKDKQEAADLIGQTAINLKKLVNHLNKKYPKDPRSKRGMIKYNSENISESEPNTNYTSYSVNKGEKIVLCVRSKTSDQKLVKLNTLMFVALHELAHVISVTIGHNEEFWTNFKFLLEEAIEIGIYTKQDFKNKPERYCGTDITESPLD